MAATFIGTSSINLLVPDITSDGSYLFGTTILDDYQSLAIPASSSVIAQKTLALMPVLSLSTISKIDSFNLYIQTLADDTSADTWIMRWMPVWRAFQTPSTQTDLRYYVFDNQDDGTKVVSRTQPATTATVDTLMHVDEVTTNTTISGGGSEVSVAATQFGVIATPYVMIDLETASNSQITISSLQIWGGRREA